MNPAAATRRRATCGGRAWSWPSSRRSSIGKDILVFGSRTLWNDLLTAGLVDELHLMVGAVVAAGGTPVFGSQPATPLRLLDTQTWEGSDNVLVRYAAAQVS